MMPESVCFDEFFIIKKKRTFVPLLYIKLKLVGEANEASSRLLVKGADSISKLRYRRGKRRLR